MFEQIKYNTIMKKLDEFVTDDQFKEKIKKLIEKMEDNYITVNKRVIKKYIIWSGNIDGIETTLKIIVTNDSVEYFFDKCDTSCTEYGKFYKLKNNSITKYYQYSIFNYSDITKTKSKKEIHVFNHDLVETFQYAVNNYHEYKIKNGERVLLPNPGLSYYNVSNTYKLFRTPEDNLIMIDESKHHNEEMQHNDYKNYSIARNNHSQERYLHREGSEFNIISKEKYLDYISKKIDEQQLFENYKTLRKSNFYF